MAEIKRTEIAQLGEFGLIDHLTKDLKPQNSSTLYGMILPKCFLCGIIWKLKKGNLLKRE